MSSTDYDAWIREYVAKTGFLLGNCKTASEAMKEAFPELRIVRGHVYDAHWGKRGHIWLESPEGILVDPTAAQFPWLYEYEEWHSGDEVRVGKCRNCGKEIWKSVDSLDVDHSGETCCSPSCEDDAISELEA